MAKNAKIKNKEVNACQGRKYSVYQTITVNFSSFISLRNKLLPINFFLITISKKKKKNGQRIFGK